MDNVEIKYAKWSDRLALDIALILLDSGVTLEEVAEKHRLTVKDIDKFKNDPIFIHQVDTYKDKITAGGITFKLRAEAQAVELLDTAWQLIHSADTSAAVKADLIKSTVKWAGYEPKPDQAVADIGAGSGVRITINLGGPDDTKTIIDQAPIIEHEEPNV